MLFDTQILIWLLYQPDRLSLPARRMLADRSVAAWFSAVSIWEIAIKQSSSKAGFPANAAIVREELLRLGMRELVLTSAQAIGTAGLPPFHKDPFDRVLIAQSLHEGLVFVTADKSLAGYSQSVRDVS